MNTTNEAQPTATHSSAERFPFQHGLSRPLRRNLYNHYVRDVIQPWAAETWRGDWAEHDEIEAAKRSRYIELGLGDWDSLYAGDIAYQEYLNARIGRGAPALSPKGFYALISAWDEATYLGHPLPKETIAERFGLCTAAFSELLTLMGY